MPEGIILKGIGGFYEVLDNGDMSSVYTCKVRGVHRKEGGKSPLPGDRVTYDVLNKNKKEGHIDKILDRRNFFIRPPVSNIDQMAVVMSVSCPEPDLQLVDKLLITCQAKDIRPIIIINKADLDSGCIVDDLKSAYECTGFSVIVLNKINRDGYEILHEKLAGQITAFAGQSGVGKSTILNTILDNWLMDTGDVSSRIQRGKHTTRHVQLFGLDRGGFILDTPGFSSFGISEVAYNNLESFYPEFSESTGRCRFKGCSHTNEPSCAVRSLLEDGKLDKGRYYRYTDLYKELKEIYDNRYRR